MRTLKIERSLARGLAEINRPKNDVDLYGGLSIFPVMRRTPPTPSSYRSSILPETR